MVFWRWAILCVLVFCAGCGEQADEVAVVSEVESVVAEPMSDAEVRDRRREIHNSLAEFSQQLEAEGRYDCCVKTPCTWCALNTGGCSCGEGLRRGEPVCEQCAYLWRRGQGDEPGIDPASVESFLEAERELNQSKEPAPIPAAEDPKACVCGEEKEGAKTP